MRFHMNGAMSPNPLLRPGQVVTGGSGGAESNLFWALVYVPQGTTAGALNVATAGGDGRERRRRKQPLLGARVCPSRDNCRGTQRRNSRRNSKQHVRTQPVCHELRRHRPYSRSYQDLLSYLSRNLNDGDKISLLIRPTLDGAATIISLCVRYAITLN